MCSAPVEHDDDGALGDDVDDCDRFLDPLLDPRADASLMQILDNPVGDRTDMTLRAARRHLAHSPGRIDIRGMIEAILISENAHP